MDTETPPQDTHQEDFSPTSIASQQRPRIPPKPKSTSSRTESDESKAGVGKSSVGTQVNLLAKRRTQEFGRNGDLKFDSDITKSLVAKDSDEDLKSPVVCASKPVIPPKPSPALIVSPRKSFSPQKLPSTPKEAATPKLSQPESCPVKPPCRKVHAPYASIDELIDLTNENLAINGSKRQSYHQPSSFETKTSGNTLPPDSSQRTLAQRKSTSLGRRTIFSPFTSIITSSPSSFSRVSHLDLTSSSQLVSILLSQEKLGPPLSKTAPPPPPRRRNSQKLQPSTSGFENTSLSQRHQSAPVSPSISSPIYAVVDKEKKWETRRLKEENERLNNTFFTSFNPPTQFDDNMSSEIKTELVTNESLADSLPDYVPEAISPTGVPNSWLTKFIAQKNIGILNAQAIDSLEIDPVVDPEENETEDDVFLRENSSFLFSNGSTAMGEELGSLPPVAQKDENVIQNHDIEERIFEDVCVAQAHESTVCEEHGIVNTEDLTASRVSKSYSKSPSPEPYNPEPILPEDTTDSLLSPARVDDVNASAHCIGVDEVVVEKSESVLFLSGMTEGQASTEEIKERSANSDAHLIYEIIRSQEQFKPQVKRSETKDSISLVDKDGEDSMKQEPEPDILSKEIWQPVLPPLITGGSFRRRSWTCSEHASSFTESSPTSSSSNSLRERTISISGSINSHSQWADEGELSTGALGDAENSDACQGGSVEDFTPASLRTLSDASSSRPKRLVNSIFASFGKSGVGSHHGRRLTGVRSTIGARRKDKSKSQFFFDALQIASSNKKAKSEFYLARGNAIRVNLDRESFNQGSVHSHKNSATPQHSPASQKSQSPADFGKRYHQSCKEGGKGEPSPSPGDLVDKSNIATALYDDIVSGLTESRDRQAFYVAREILTSEKTFVDVLNLLTIEFPKFIANAEAGLGHAIIRKGALESILGDLPNLKLVNESLIHDLEDRISSWRSNPKVSDIIVKTGPFLKHYSGYIRDYQKLSERFDHICEKNPHFAKAVTEFEKTEICRNLKLRHFMLKPVQRMPQYALLLGDYLKNLKPENEDYRGTIEAIRIVKEVAEHGNEAIKNQVNAEKLVQLQKRLSQNVILKSDRHLICEGELRKVCRKELQPRFFALMNDCLFCMTYAGSPTGTGSKELKLRYELPLTGMRVAIAANEEYQNEFSVVSVARSFNLVAKSPKERNDWMRELTAAIKNNIKKRAGTAQEFDRELTEIGKVAPVWTADGRVTMCQSCTAEFTITFRRHHCRACGKVVCGHCSGNEAPLQYLNYEATRVCDDCYALLMEEFDLENRQNSHDAVEAIRNRFKKGTPSISKRGTKHKKSIPNRLEVHGNTRGSAMSGYLNWREGRKAWKKNWFALVERVLYVYAASEDIAAIRGIPILGYQVEHTTISEEDLDGIDSGKSIFQLTHSGQDPYIFQADSSSSSKRWIAAMKEATIMKSDDN